MVLSGGAKWVTAVVTGMVMGVVLVPMMLFSDTECQAATIGGGTFDGSGVPEQYRGFVERAGGVCAEISPALIAAQIEAESGWQANATSPVGARGISQFMPATWASVGVDGDGDGRADVTNPADAIYSQGVYMCGLYRNVKAGVDAGEIRLGDKSLVELTLASYNAGFGSVKRAHGYPANRETNAYLERIGSFIKKYQKQLDAPQPGAAPEAGVSGVSGTDVVSTQTGGWDGRFGAPIVGALRVTSPFGMRVHPVTGRYLGHQGVDYASPAGQAQYATAPGVVSRVGPYSTCGNVVKIDHGEFRGHKWSTTHCHLSVVEVSVGARVRAGDEIGKTGATGRVTGPHVHYQIEQDGSPIDPAPFMAGAVANPTGSTPTGGSEGVECPQGGGSGPGSPVSVYIADPGVAGDIPRRAATQFGVPYVYGGGSLDGPSGSSLAGGPGFDCSGLVRFAVYQASDGKVELGRDTNAQYSQTKANTVTTDYNQLDAVAKPGDLIFWGTPTQVTHVAIYVGNHRMIHAPHRGEVVKEAAVYRGKFLAVTRLATQ